jgi:RNA polymerase sigma factor (sigma-70 family)
MDRSPLAPRRFAATLSAGLGSDRGHMLADEGPPGRDHTSGEREALAAAVRRVAQGDAAALEDVYRRTSVKLFGLCLRILPDRAEAEDILQEIYIAVWHKAGGFDAARGTAMTWLLTLARNRAIDRLRAANRHVAAPIDLAATEADRRPSAFDRIAAGEEERRMASCLAALEGGDAGLIEAAFFGGSTYAELASRAGAPLGTIKSRIRRALLRLRKCLA